MVSLHYEAHFVLLVIALDDEDELQFSVLDSKCHHYRQISRDRIYKTMRNIMNLARWGWPLFAEARKYDDTNYPEHAIWIPVSQQPSDDECGHYVTLNAWSLALSLEINPDVRILWTDSFFEDLLDVEHLARIGVADWRLVYAFLRCHNFVTRDREVPRERRFTQSAAFDKEKDLETKLDSIGMLEEVHWSEIKVDPLHLANANRIELSAGRTHDDAMAFPSDNWSEWSRTELVPDLERWGLLDLEHTDPELQQDWEANVFLAGNTFEESIQQRHGADIVLTAEQILAEYREFVLSWRPFNMNGWLTKLPCPWFADWRYTWECFLEHDPLTTSLNIVLQQGRANRDLFDWEVSIAIAAVVEAIDHHHRDLHAARHPGQNPPFAGGLSVTSTDDLQYALMNHASPFLAGVSRPRRSCIIPLIVSGNLLVATNDWRRKNKKPFKEPRHGQGHTILALLQEERKNEGSPETHFRTRSLDSSPEVLATGLPRLQQAVQEAAHCLQWSTHRKIDGRVQYEQGEPRMIPVPRQRGNSTCGYHTVINAWILAMGLTPSLQAQYTEEIYTDAWKIIRAAVAGILDSRSLMAWFICKHLTVQGASTDVPEERRFVLSMRQDPQLTKGKAYGTGSLSERAGMIYATEDTLLAGITENIAPYDRSTNLNLITPPPPSASGTEKKSLERSYDDSDFEVDRWHSRTKRTRYEMEHDSLDFLNEYDADEDAEALEPPLKRAKPRWRSDESVSFFGYLAKLFQ